MPSITYRGSLDEVIDDAPRTRIEAAPPGAPEFCVTCTPATRPCNIWSALVMADVFSFSAEIDAIEPVRSERFCTP